MPHPAPAHKSFSDRTSLYQDITDTIIAELEQGRVPWVQPWGGVRAPLGFPHNAATGRAYSGINILKRPHIFDLFLWKPRRVRSVTERIQKICVCSA